MLVLHGFWSRSGSLRLWAEDSDLLVKSPSQALRSARPHPFAAAADAIAGYIRASPVPRCCCCRRCGRRRWTRRS